MDDGNYISPIGRISPISTLLPTDHSSDERFLAVDAARDASFYISKSQSTMKVNSILFGHGDMFVQARTRNRA